MEEILVLVKDKNSYNQTKISKMGFETVKALLAFPAAKAFPALDLYRMLLMHPSMMEPFKHSDSAVDILGSLLSHLRNGPAPTQMMALRCLVNMFKNNSSFQLLTNQLKGVLDTVAPKLCSDNKNVRQSALTLMLNCSMIMIDSKHSQGRQHLIELVQPACIFETDCKNY